MHWAIIKLKNGEEEILIDDSRITGDSIYIPMHIFDADLVASISDVEMKGFWRKNYAKDYIIPFSAKHGETFRFMDQPVSTGVNIEGKWESPHSYALVVPNPETGNVRFLLEVRYNELN